MLPVAVQQNDLPLGLVGVVVAAMIVAFLLDRVARSVGLRRDKRLDCAAAILACGAGAYLGWLDGDRYGALIGGIVGLIAGTLAASVLFGAIAVVWSVIAGPRPNPDVYVRDEDQKKKSFLGGRLTVLAGGILPVAFSALLAHEVFWMGNLATLSTQYTVGFTMADFTSREQPRERLLDALQQRRPALLAAQWRPQNRLLYPKYADENAAAAAYIAFLSGEAPPADKPPGWNTDWEETLWEVWRLPNFEPDRIPAEHVNALGVNIANERFALFNECLDRTLILGRLPRTMFARDHKVVNRPAPRPQ